VSLPARQLNASAGVGDERDVIMSVPFGTPAVYVNLTGMDGKALASAHHNNEVSRCACM
jgi:hypothetical protein